MENSKSFLTFLRTVPLLIKDIFAPVCDYAGNVDILTSVIEIQKENWG